jgi:hypothetical protein
MNTTQDVARKQDREEIVYERPQLTVLGTLADLTRGIVPTHTDGFGPGSALTY